MVKLQLWRGFIVTKEFTDLDFENYIKVEHGYLILPEPDESSFVSNLSVEGFARIDAAARYKPCLQQMIDVFKEQHVYGIRILIIKCLLDNMQKLEVLLETTND